MKKKLIIIGASGHGKVVADIAELINKWDIIEFLDDNESIKRISSYKVIGTSDIAKDYISKADIFIAIGNNKIRKSFVEKLISKGASIPTLIHPNAVIGSEVSIGIGSVVMAGVVVNTSVSIGKACIVNTSSSIDHDCIISSFTHISPGVNIAGAVKIGNETWIGTGAKITNNIEVCENVVIGAGAVVIRDITESGTYVGVPARKLT